MVAGVIPFLGVRATHLSRGAGGQEGKMRSHDSENGIKPSPEVEFSLRQNSTSGLRQGFDAFKTTDQALALTLWE
jgi:hypothetical protein